MSGSRKNTEWSSDVRPSMPEPPTAQRMVKMGGFVFTPTGMAHDLTQEDVEDIVQSPFLPPRTV